MPHHLADESQTRYPDTRPQKRLFGLAARNRISLSLSLSFSSSSYSAFRQNFPKLWTSVAHSFLQQIAQNKNWAHPKGTTLPRICKAEILHASLLDYSAKPQSGGILGCALRHCTSEPFDSRRFVEACLAYGASSQYPAWSRCRRSADVPRADHDRGWLPWKGGFKERDTQHANLPFVWFFRHLKMQPPLSSSSTKKTIDVTDLSWPKTIRFRLEWSKAGRIRAPSNWNYALKLKIDTKKINWGLEDGIESLSWNFELNQTRNRFFKSNKVLEKNNWMHCTSFFSQNKKKWSIIALLRVNRVHCCISLLLLMQLPLPIALYKCLRDGKYYFFDKVDGAGGM